MGFYDAIDRRGAGRSRGRSLHAWVLLAAAVLVMGAALIVWACSSQHQYRTIVSALADATLRTNPRPVDGAAIAQLLENLQ